VNPAPEWFTLVPNQVYLMIGIEDQFVANALEMTRSYDQVCTALLESSNASLVHMITDLRAVKSFPPISSISGMHFLRHPRMGHYITLGALDNAVLRFIATIVGGITRLRYGDVKTLEDAYSLLLSKDPSLPRLEAWALPPERDMSV
jgi:hypothetical protein